MNVRKRGLALLMCICMIFTLLPFSAFAEDPVDDGSHTHSEANGVVMDKRVEKTGDDTYKVTLEQYVTGTVTQGTVTPIDVVLVLDVSGSMVDNNKISSITYNATYSVKTGSIWNRNIYYVKDGDSYKAVKYCSDCEAYADTNRHGYISWSGYVLNHTTKYTPKTSASDDNSNHVQFYERVEGTPITKLEALQNAVNSFIDTIAAKNKDSKIAIVKFAGDKNEETGNNTYYDSYWEEYFNCTQIVKELTEVNVADNVAELKKAVTDLTAGGATRADWGLEKAKEAFGSEDVSSDRQRVVIMFTDGVPTSGDQFEKNVANGAISAANTLKKSSKYDGYDAKVYTIAVYKDASVSETLPNDSGINRYMHLVSSNYPNAIDLSNTGDGNPKGGYYKVAKNEKELSDAFTQIGDAEGTPDITLDSSAVLTDVVAGNFKAPANASGVTVYTADYDGSEFADRAAWTNITSNVKVDITGQNVTVTGFNYSANFVTNNEKADGTYGKKLIVEFTITVDRTKTYGGTQPTNAGANIKLGDEIVASVADPKVPVAITQPTISDVPKEKPYDGAGFDIKNTFEDQIATQVPTNGSKNEYVNIVYTIKDDKGNEVGKYTVDAKGTNGKWSSAEALTTPADVGEYVYKVTCTISDAKTTEPHAASVSAEGTMTFKITSRTGLTVSGTDYNVVYDGQEHGDAAVAMIGDTIVTDGVTISYKVGTDEWTKAVPKVKDVADSTKVQVKAEKAGYTPAEATYKLIVTPRDVTLTSESATKAYDGTPLTKPVVTVGGDGFVDGEVSDIKATGTVTNSSEGEVTNTIVYTKNQNYKDSNYSITKNEGKLSIYDTYTVTYKYEYTDGTPVPETVLAAPVDSNSPYRAGSPVTVLNAPTDTIDGYIFDGWYIGTIKMDGMSFEIMSDTVIIGKWKPVTGLTCTINYIWNGNQTTPIRTDIIDKLTYNEVVKKFPMDIPGYTPVSNYSKEIVVKTTGNVINFYYYKNVTLESNSGTFTYDGKDHSVSGYDVITKADNGKDVKVDAEFSGVSASRTEKDVGSYPVTFNIRGDVVDKEALIGKIDSNSYYIVSDVKEGTLTIEKIKDEVTVKITGNNKTVTYNGKEQSVEGYVADTNGLPITVSLATGKTAFANGTEVGTYKMNLAATDFVATSDIYGNIKIVIVEDGWLKINRRPMPPVNPGIGDEIIVEITGNSDSVVYDGTEHSVKDYTVKISDPRYTEADFTFTGKAEASGVNAGTYEMGLKAEQFKNTNARFTNVKFVIKADGVLTITPKDLIITAGSKTEYGPTPVTCGEWTVSGLVAGDKVESVKITGIQSVPGSSPNVPSDAVIKNAKGEDVTKNYAIKYVNGTLTMLEVLNKEDHFNYIIGTPEGLSLPTANVTRAEVATIFFRLMTDDARAKFDSLDNNFSDVAKGKWYNRAISTLANAGIIKGDPAGTYRPGDPITRAEMAAIIARFGDFKEGGKTFNDISGHWAQKYIELAASNGWINGNPDGTFKPNNNITRAETVAMINRVLDRQTKDVSDLLPVAQMTNWSDNMDTAKWYYRDMQEATNNHKAERVGDSIYEKWTEKLPDIDWASYQI